MRFSNLALLCSLAASACALHIPFKARATGSVAKTARLIRRADSPPNASDPYHFENIDGLFYVGTVVVEGNSFEVQLDTGSSDLWIDTTGVTFPNAENTNIQSGVTYLDGTSATGPILLTEVSFGNWTVPKQAFISAPGATATSGGDKGLLGIGPPSLSSIAETLNATQYNGNSFLDNVFSAYPNDPNIITFLLSRGDSGITDGGDFTIGTIVSGYENILKAPVLPVISAQSWMATMNGIISNGTTLQGNSSYLESTSQLSFILDSGTTLAIAPRSYVDLLYSNIPEAVWMEELGTYVFDCTAVVNVSVIFGEQVVFLHPIDISTPYAIQSDGTVVCEGSFSVNANAGVDFLLGDAFMKNVYSLFFFGNWTTSATGPPYLQILPITNPDQAFTEFPQLNAQRIDAFVAQLNNSTTTTATGNSNTGTTTSTGNPSTSTDSKSNTLTSSKDNSVSGAVSGDGSSPTIDLSSVNRNSYIIMGLVGIAILLLITNIAMGSRKNTGYKEIGARDSAPHPHFVETDRPYSTPYSDDR